MNTSPQAVHSIVKGLRILTGRSREPMMAMAAIDGAQGLNGAISVDNVKSAGSASLIVTLGLASPPMTRRAPLANDLRFSINPLSCQHHLPRR